jgi:hypothetical protein
MNATLELRRARARSGSAPPRRLIGFFAAAALACGLLHAAPAVAQTVPVAGAPVHIRYETTTTYSAIRDLLQQHKVLEKAQVFLSPLRLPRELTIRTAECGAPSVPFDAQKSVVTICYEAVADIQALAKGATSDPDDLAGLITGGVVEEALHRMALAILQVFDVPVWGREEDAADMLGAFLMLQFDERTANVTILGAAQLFVYKTSALGKVDYVSDVSPPAQRFYNFLCIAVGGDPIDFGGLVDKGFLPKDRARGCGGEYDKVRRAFDMRLMPHVDADLVVKIRAIDWLHEDKN